MNIVDFVEKHIDELRSENGFLSEDGEPIPDLIHFRCPVCRQIAYRYQDVGQKRRVPELSVHKVQCDIRIKLESQQ